MPTKVRIEYTCTECGSAAPKWAGKCDDCGAWNSLEETTVAPKSASKAVSRTNHQSRYTDLVLVHTISYWRIVHTDIT